VILYEQIVHRGGIVNYNALAQGSDTMRIRYQNVALQILRDHLFNGAGFQQLSICALKYVKNDPNYVPESGTHNIYLHLAAETGIISLFAFLLFIATMLRKALGAPFHPLTVSLTAIFIAFLFIGLCDFYPILLQQGKVMFFLTAGLLAAQFSPNPHFSHARVIR
jgi:O-antigen ligase